MAISNLPIRSTRKRSHVVDSRKQVHVRPLPLGNVGMRLERVGSAEPIPSLPPTSAAVAGSEWSVLETLNELVGIGAANARGAGKSWPPSAPPGVDIEANINEAEGKWNPVWFYNQVRNKGPWDFKQLGRQYEDFGNFHYGATGTAFGFPESVLLNMAGRAQKAAGNSLPAYGEPGPIFWPFSGTGSYGDDPKDQYWIKKGIDFYTNRDQWYDPPRWHEPPRAGARP